MRYVGRIGSVSAPTLATAAGDAAGVGLANAIAPAPAGVGVNAPGIPDVPSVASLPDSPPTSIPGARLDWKMVAKSTSTTTSAIETPCIEGTHAGGGPTWGRWGSARCSGGVFSHS